MRPAAFPASWQRVHRRADAERHLCVNHLNGDGVVGFDDIDAYVACLIASGCD